MFDGEDMVENKYELEPDKHIATHVELSPQEKMSIAGDTEELGV